jgi:hypothetical protein
MSDDCPTLSEVGEQNIRGYLRRNRIGDEPGFNPMPAKFRKPRIIEEGDH